MQNFSSWNNSWAISYLLKSFGLEVKRSQISQELLFHPDFPSPLSILEVMRSRGIPCEGYRLNTGELKKIPLPFMAEMKKGEFSVLSAINESSITYHHPFFGTKTISKIEFEKNWTGLVLSALPPKIHLKEYHENTGTSDLPVFLASLIGLILIISLIVYSSRVAENLVAWWGLILINLFSFFVCYVLVSPHLVGNKLILKVCPPNKKFDCLSVISSPIGTIFGLPLADLGAFFFLGSFFLLITSTLRSSQFIFESWATALLLIYLPISLLLIIYQWLVVKKWCLACLCLQLLAWTELSILMYINPVAIHHVRLSLPPTEMFFSFLTAATLWLFLRDWVQKNDTIKTLQPSYWRSRRHPKFIEFAINGSRKTTSFKCNFELIVGNSGSNSSITVVVSPWCRHCHDVVRLIQALLSAGYEKSRFRILFFLSPPPDGTPLSNLNPDYQVVCRILTLLAEGKTALAIEAFFAWFSEDSSEDPIITLEQLNSWLDKFSTSDNSEIKYSIVKSIIENHYKWIKENNIVATPTTIIEDKLLPGNTSFRDAIYYIMR